MGIYVIMILMMGVSWYVSNKLQSKFKKYSQTPLSSNLSGQEIAEKMLRDHDIFDVKVISVSGQLTDHYNPANKTVNLSDGVYHARNAAAAAVAAHECGHAVQHARAYSWLTFRSKIVPVVSVTSRYVQWVLLAGVLLINAARADEVTVLWVYGDINQAVSISFRAAHRSLPLPICSKKHVRSVTYVRTAKSHVITRSG